MENETTYGMSSQRAQLAQLVVKRLLAFQEGEGPVDANELIREMLTDLDTHHQHQIQLLGEIQELLSPQTSDGSGEPVHSSLS